MKKLLLGILSVLVLNGTLYAKEGFHHRDVHPVPMVKYKIKQAFEHQHYFKAVRYHKKQIRHNKNRIEELMAEVRRLKKINQNHYRFIRDKQQKRDNHLSYNIIIK